MNRGLTVFKIFKIAPDHKGSETCWSNFEYFIIILIVSTNYIFVHLLDNKVLQSRSINKTWYFYQ